MQKIFQKFLRNEKLFCKNYFLKSEDVSTLSKWDCQRLFRSCGCVAIFNKYGRTTEIVLETIIVHQQEAITQNKSTHLHLICNRKWRKTVEDWSIVKIFLSSVRVFSRSYAYLRRNCGSQCDCTDASIRS